MENIQELFFLPPTAVARLGGSSTPLASFTWVEDPSLHGAGLTAIEPTVSLEIADDGSVRPFRPKVIQFRDFGLYRPDFFELWLRREDREEHFSHRQSRSSSCIRTRCTGQKA